MDAPMSFVGIKRSFSMYKVLLADDRQQFEYKNLKNYFIINNVYVLTNIWCNNKLYYLTHNIT